MERPNKQIPMLRSILSLYDYTGNMSNAYRAAGYQIIQIDTQLNSLDVRMLPYQPEWNIYGIIAMPPCTYFSKARSIPSPAQLLDGLSTVDAVFRLVQLYNPVFWVIENPHKGRLQQFLGKPRQVVPLGAFGFETPKPTALWGSFNKVAVPRYLPDSSPKFESIKHSSRSTTPLRLGQAFFNANH